MSLNFSLVPYDKLDYQPEIKKLKVFSAVVASFSLDPKSLLYTGIGGKEIIEIGKPKDLPRTYGHTYGEWESIARQIDYYESASVDQTPLYYALLHENEDRPTIIAYDLEYMTTDKNKHPNLWYPKREMSLADAARLAIAITFESQ